MPTDLLLPIFALTLLANAVLIALAIRSLRRGRPESAPTRDWFTPAATASPSPPVARPRDALAEPRADAGARAAAPALPPAPDAAPDAMAGAARPRPATASDPELATPAPARAGRTRSGPRSTTPVTAPGPVAEPVPRRGRRKFSMPPIDDDHEKVTRSIESFLAGSDGPIETSRTAGATASASDGDARPEPATGGRGRAAGADGPSSAPTTIALIAIAGLGNSSDGPDPVTIESMAMLERALRGTARGGDEVHRVGNGRFRIVLPATGELAARAYLRRIRASVEPQLEAAERPLHLVVATATALNVTIGSATVTARRRLDAALGAQPVGAGRAGAAGASVDDQDAADEGDHDDGAVDDGAADMSAADRVDRDAAPKPRAAGD